MQVKLIAAIFGCAASLAAFAQAQPPQPGAVRPGDTVTIVRGMNETVLMNLPSTWKLGGGVQAGPAPDDRVRSCRRNGHPVE